MNLTFLGAAGTVTGSRYLVQAGGKKVLVDCGLFQGYKELRLRNWDRFPVAPAEIDAVILTHAHLDHSGYLPLLVKHGFRGRIYCTETTMALCELLLPDSGFLQEEDAKRANKYGYTKHKPALPLYTQEDARESLRFFHPVKRHTRINVSDDLFFRLGYAGHILGASWVQMTGGGKTILFSGDIGRPHDPVMKAPEPPPPSDYLVIESTYGNRRHEAVDPMDQLEPIINRTFARGGGVLIPAFAVGRAQSLMYYIHMLKRQNRIPGMPVYLDSPMAVRATGIMNQHPDEHHLSAAVCAAMSDEVRYVETPDESKKINEDRFPKIILAASGMATGGRVLHHLKHMAGDHRNTIVFAGFQAGGTRGDRILRGEKTIKIHGEMVHINAEVTQLHSVSAHADYQEIIDWIGGLPKPRTVYITHGEPSASYAMKQALTEARPGWNGVIPDHMQKVSL